MAVKQRHQYFKMKYKKDVNATDIKHQVWFAIGFAEALCRLNDLDEVVVTSLRDGVHGVNSLHPKGLAADIRTRNMKDKTLKIFNLLRMWLDPQGFDTVLESDHIHIEFQPKTGESFDGRVA